MIINRIKPAYLRGLRVKCKVRPHRGPRSPCTSSGDPNRREFAHSPNSVAGHDCGRCKNVTSVNRLEENKSPRHPTLVSSVAFGWSEQGRGCRAFCI